MIEGEIEVSHYAVLKEVDGRAKVAPVNRLRALAGDANFLIPPFEYHSLANDLTNRSALTLHVYGGEMLEMNAFEPRTDGWYELRSRKLSYDEV